MTNAERCPWCGELGHLSCVRQATEYGKEGKCSREHCDDHTSESFDEISDGERRIADAGYRAGYKRALADIDHYLSHERSTALDRALVHLRQIGANPTDMALDLERLGPEL
jgi:hypothetical protein